MEKQILPNSYGWLGIISVILSWIATTAAIYFMWNNVGVANIFQLQNIDIVQAIELQIFLILMRSGVKISLLPNKYKFV